MLGHSQRAGPQPGDTSRHTRTSTHTRAGTMTRTCRQCMQGLSHTHRHGPLHTQADTHADTRACRGRHAHTCMARYIHRLTHTDMHACGSRHTYTCTVRYIHRLTPTQTGVHAGAITHTYEPLHMCMPGLGHTQMPSPVLTSVHMYPWGHPGRQTHM